MIFIISEEMSSKEFKINQFLSLKLGADKTIIYVGGEPFKQCKYLLLNIPIKEITSLDELESLDEASEKLDHRLEPSHENVETNLIPPEVEFWGHCSNLQVWYENDYNTKLLHSNLAFPLLKRLTQIGDSLAKKVFKEEIAVRYNKGIESVRKYLERRKYLDYLTKEEFYSLIDTDTEYEGIKELEQTIDRDKLEIDIKNGKVSKLSIRGLTEVPECIRELKSLEYLNLGFGTIKRLPEWIGEFQSLKRLIIFNNELNHLPSSIGKIKSLEVLEAYNNKLKGLPETIGRLASLKKLTLSTNQLKKLPNSIGNLSSLKKFELYENNLKELPLSIGDLSSLEKLNINRNKLGSLPETIGKLKSLKSLVISDNKIGYIPRTICNLKKLEILGLSKNNLKSIPISIGSLISLKQISINDNLLEEIPESIYEIPDLRVISIKNTNITSLNWKKIIEKNIEVYDL